MITDHEAAPTVAPSFDFHSYLLDLTGQQWLIEELLGGNANHTVRGICVADHVNESSQDGGHYGGLGIVEGHTSVVLKQAPPYFVKFPDMPFSEYRQTIEAKALSLWHAPSLSGVFTLSPVLHSNPSIRIPRLLHHDLSALVLIQSDLGTHPLLDQVLTSQNTTPSQASSTGTSLGRFLKDLHTAFDDTPEARREELRQLFTNNEGEAVLCEVITNTINLMRDAGVEDYALLGRRALDNWTKRGRTVFGQGDIWFGTILVRFEDGEVEVGICDWEFAGFNHPAGDIAQLGSYLHLSSMSPLSTPMTQMIIQSFSSAFYSSYFPLTPSSNFSQAEFQRSLVIMHAWEMINAAAWRHHLWCSCPGKGVKCEHITEMIKVGARLLRAAGDGEDDVIRVDWEALKDVEWCRFLKVS